MKRWIPALAACAFLAAGCHRDMWQQPKVESQSESPFYQADKSGSRWEPAGTVAYGEAKTDTAFHTGYDDDGRLVKEFPSAVTREMLERGEERYTVFCTPCHGQIGDGKGMIAQRGFEASIPVASYHTDRLREIPVGHFFDVITNGTGAMYAFGARIPVEDRWAIAAYIRVLQKSQNVNYDELSSEEQQKVQTGASGSHDDHSGDGHEGTEEAGH